MLGMETWLGLEDALKAAKQQARTDEQDRVGNEGRRGRKREWDPA
jgi:hypothetical protein